MSKLPTKPGAYYWRKKDGDAWVAVHVVEDCSIPGHDFVVLFPETQALVDLVDLHGQWLPIPAAKEVMELLWRVHNVLDNPRPIKLQHLGEYALKLFKEIGE